MKIKEEKGIATTDIVISVLIITIFITVIGTMLININLGNNRLERKENAINYAIHEIENIKAQGYLSGYNGLGTSSQETLTESDIEKNEEFTGYHKKILIADYKIINTEDNSIVQDILKKITVEISYNFSGNEQKISLSTYVAK